MNKKLFLFFFLSFCSCHTKYAEKQLACIQIVGRNGLTETISTKERLSIYQSVNFFSSQPYKQVLRIYQKNKEGKTSSTLTSYHPNGTLHQYLEIVDARACGRYQQWHPNGFLQLDAFVIGGPADLSPFSQQQWLFDGMCKVWDEQGCLLSEIAYVKGILEGNSIYYHPNGKIKTILPYHEDVLEGCVLEYTQEQKTLSESHFVKGVKTGLSVGYWENRKQCFLETYDQSLVTMASYFNPLGQQVGEIKNGKGEKVLFKESKIYQRIEYRQGRPEGKVQTFTPKGERVNLYHTKNEKKEGIEKEYYLQEELESSPYVKKKTKQQKLSIQWQDNKIHGTVKTWYLNGSLESQRAFSNNKKNGPSCGWYENGDIMFVEEYEEDVLLEGQYYKKNDSFVISRIIKGDGTATLHDKDGLFLKKIHYYKGKPLER